MGLAVVVPAAHGDEQQREEHTDDHGQRCERDLLVFSRVECREQPNRLHELRADVERLHLAVGQVVDDRVRDQRGGERRRRERRGEQRVVGVLRHEHGVDDRARRERADRQLSRADPDSTRATRPVGRSLGSFHGRHEGTSSPAAVRIVTVPKMAERDELLIVGGGLSSARAIKSFREAGGEGTVRLLSADSVIPYHRPPLSKKYLRGDAEVADTLVEAEAFYAEHGVEVELETVVSTLDLEGRRVLLEGGEAREFDKLLIASGATPRRLDVPGIDLEGVHTLRTLDNSTAIREVARGARHAVVVGAGFIGMEVAASLKQLGLEVTLVHRGKGLFELLRARQLMQFLADLYAREGVEIVLGDEVRSFGGRSPPHSLQ